MGKAYLRICEESSFGVLPGVPSWKYYYLDDDAYTVREQRGSWIFTPVGFIKRMWNTRTGRLPGGTLKTFIQKVNAPQLFSMFYDRDSDDELKSFSAEYQDSRRTVRHMSGLRLFGHLHADARG